MLAERIRRQQWQRLISGDVLQFSGSRSRFAIGCPDRELEQRCHECKISPTGPLPGAGELPELAAGELESGVLSEYTHWLDALAAAGLDSDRRSLRLVINHFHWRLFEASLELEFELPAGAFATSVLREIGDFRDAGREINGSTPKDFQHV